MIAPSVPQLLIVLAVAALIFGTKNLKGLGGDLGGALRSFRKAMSTDEKADAPATEDPQRLTSEQRDQEQKKV